MVFNKNTIMRWIIVSEPLRTASDTLFTLVPIPIFVYSLSLRPTHRFGEGWSVCPWLVNLELFRNTNMSHLMLNIGIESFVFL